MSIRFENASFTYPGGRAGVAGIDIEVGDGELVALIGPSGSGKTTCLKLLAGFIAPDSGRMLVDGEDVAALPPERRRLGVVFQNYALFPHMNLRDNVAYALKVRGVARAERRRRADAMLSRVGLSGMGERFPATLSGGQQQRVALARALVFEPRALLLDEPLSALDAALRVAMRDEIRAVQKDVGICALHVTHDQEEALSIADRVVVMREGRVEQQGSPRDIYDRPATRFVAGFVGHANFLEGVVREGGVVETPLGPLQSHDARDWKGGSAATVLIRPEAIRFADASAQGATPNLLFGTVGADRFLGSLRRCDFHVEGGMLSIETSDRDAAHCVAIPPEAIRLLPADNRHLTTGEVP